MGVLSIEEVLAAEAKAIHGENPGFIQSEAPSNQSQHEARKQLNADTRPARSEAVKDAAKTEDKDRREFYQSLNKLSRVALCCSGGGIRSATFCLGVIQALAHYDVTKLVTAAESAQTAVAKTKTPEAKIESSNSLLGRFHYLSTVSGGGYIGSWLSAWRARADFVTVINDLTGRPEGADVEPPAISWLRAYSNYLTPTLGITSADTWAAVAIFVRNLILNWLVIIPVVCIALLLLKLIATGSVLIAHSGNDSLVFGVLFAGILSLILALAFITMHRPARRYVRKGISPDEARNVSQRRFLWGDLLWAVISAVALAVVFSSRSFALHFGKDWTSLPVIERLSLSDLSKPVDLIWVTAIVAAVIYLAGWTVGTVSGWIAYFAGWTKASPPPLSWRDLVDLIACGGSGLIYGALIGLGAGLYALLQPYKGDPLGPSDDIRCLLLPIIFGVPWVLLSQLMAEIIFVGLVSYERNSDPDREWLGRAAGWFAAASVVWAVGAFLVFAGELFVQIANSKAHAYVAASGGIITVVSGIVTALLGSSAKTAAKTGSKSSRTALVYNIVLAVTGPIFVAGLIIGLSIGLDAALFDNSLIQRLQASKDAVSLWPTLEWLLIGSGVIVVVALLASYCVNINRFSLHALYRNRLIRAYLGASCPVRHPDPFTGFDGDDNIRVHELWSKKPEENKHRLFHVINIALNVVSTKRLAWQERKAESFTVSPLHCGSAYVGFRRSDKYGDGPDKYKKVKANDSKKATTKNAKAELPTTGYDAQRKWGIALGTAMAISGAAVSPNMGYHSSPSISLLLALFNVRLGWWLGNPGKNGCETYQTEGPKWAAKPLFYEAFGQTTDESRYVYLSDGGHFENLGLYEMVRRRCRFIVVIDAGCDPNFAFEDLGNAVRKIYIDLGIKIVFDGLDRLSNRPASAAKDIPYHAIGIIDYRSADGAECTNGHVLYIKPAYHGTEGAGIVSYATAHDTFPHEDTADQWFSESQFESYRSLGVEITNTILDRDVSMPDDRKPLHQILADLK